MLTGQIKDFSVDYKTGQANLTLTINEKTQLMNVYDELKGCEKLSIKLDKFREKRSLNANNYAWKLMTEIANIVRSDKDKIYLEMLKRYGQRETISVLAHIPMDGYVKYYEEIGESELNGKLFKHYHIFKGSSEFDTREMSIFIDGIVDDAKELGIQTDTPEMIAKMKSLWSEYEKHNSIR